MNGLGGKGKTVDFVTFVLSSILKWRISHDRGFRLLQASGRVETLFSLDTISFLYHSPGGCPGVSEPLDILTSLS